VPAVLGAVTTPPTALSSTSDLQISGPTYVARAGDTLWDVARSLPAGGDVRDRVDRLAAVNGSASVVVGQTIRIPADMLAS
jgi:nucleoid-associated protein YgaU